MSDAPGPPLAEERARAAAVLGLSPDAATSEAARAALYGRLPGEDYAPPEEFLSAFHVLTQAEVPLTPTASEGERERLRGDIETFAEGYWSLEPTTRTAT